MTDGTGGIKINRSELYDQVWKIPLSRLAREYQISDVGLAKICRKLNVPRPPRGYWTKVEFGKSVRRPPLPRISNEEPSEYIHHPYIKPETMAGGDRAAIKRISFEREIKVSKRLYSPHALVRETKAALKNLRPDEYGMLSHGNGKLNSQDHGKQNSHGRGKQKYHARGKWNSHLSMAPVRLGKTLQETG